MKAALTTAVLIQALTPGGGDLRQAADAVLQRHVKVDHAPAGANLTHERTLIDGDHAVFRYILTVDGVPVMGRGAAVRVGSWRGAPALIHADVGLGGGGLGARQLGRAWRQGPDDAVQVALGALAEPRVRGGIDSLRPFQAIVPGRPPRRVWVVDVPLIASGPLTLRLLVDGDKPVVVDWARLDLGAGRANVFPTNPASSELQERVLTGLDPDTDVLEGRFAHVFRCRLRDGECQERNAAVADNEGDYLYEPDDEHGNERDPFAEVSAYYHVTRMRELLGELGMGDDLLRRMRVWVNWPNLNNAAFVSGGPEGVSMIFGQGRRDFAYDGDVVYHEYGHAVVSATAGLLPVFGLGFGTLDYRPGALNEGIADQLSTALSDDSRLGEYAGGYRYGAEIRDMDGDATCPEGQIGEEHHDSQPWGQATWEVRQGLGDEDYLPLAWSTLTMLLPSSGISEAAAVMGDLATQRFAGQEDKLAAVVDPLARHALQRCERYVPIDEIAGHSAVSLSSSELTQGQLFFDMPSHLQHTVTVPEGALQLRLIKRMIGCVIGCEQQIVLRHGEPVTFALRAGGRLDFDADHDIAQQTEVVLTDPEAGVWYIGNVNGTSSTFIYSMSAEVVMPPAPDPDPDPGQDPDPDVDPDPDPPPDDDPAANEGEGELGADDGPAGSPGDLPEPTPDKPGDSCLCGRSTAPLTWTGLLRR